MKRVFSSILVLLTLLANVATFAAGSPLQTVQKVSSGTTTSLVLTPVTTTAAKTLLVCAVYGADSAPVVTFADTATNTYTSLGTSSDVPNNVEMQCWSSQNTTALVAGSMTMSLTQPEDCAFVVQEITGLDTGTAPLGGTFNVQQTPGTGADAVVSPTVNNTFFNAYLVAVSMVNGATAVIPTQNGAYTSDLTGFNFGDGARMRIAHRSVAVTGNQTATFTVATSSATGTVLTVFQETTAPGGTVVNPISGRGGAAAQPLVH